MEVSTQSSCEKDEGWQRSMGIDSLSRGRDQPFYHAILSEGPERYVAEENIAATPVPPDVLAEFVDNISISLGRYFSDAHVVSSSDARLVDFSSAHAHVAREGAHVAREGAHIARDDMMVEYLIPSPELRVEYPDDRVETTGTVKIPVAGKE